MAIWDAGGGPQVRAWLGTRGGALVRTARRIGAVPSALVRRLRGLSPDRVFWVVMGLILLFYAILLVTQPTGAGRGGR